MFLFEKRENHFNVIHSDLPSLLSKIASEQSLKQFIHLSALGIEEASDSNYALSKLSGEKKVRQNFPSSVILKPSIVYSVDDNFTTNFMNLLSILPVMPLYYGGKTKFTPIHASDVANLVFSIISNGSTVVSKLFDIIFPDL